MYTFGRDGGCRETSWDSTGSKNAKEMPLEQLTVRRNCVGFTFEGAPDTELRRRSRGRRRVHVQVDVWTKTSSTLLLASRTQNTKAEKGKDRNAALLKYSVLPGQDTAGRPTTSDGKGK